MGLLDMFGTSMDDPRTAATLQLAQGLLSSPRVMQGLAGGLSGYQQAMAQAKQAKAVEEMRQMQLQQMQMQMAAQRQQQEQAQLDREGFQRFLSPVTPIEANAASGIVGPRPEALKAVGQLPPLDPRLMAGAKMSPEAIKQAFEISQIGVKQPMKLGAGEAVFSPDGRMLFGNPKEDATDPYIRFLKQAGIDPASPRGQQLLQAKAIKDSTHTPAVSVSYGAPVAGVDAQGNPVFFQPSKDGKAPAIIPGVAPSKDKNYTEDQAKAAGWLAQAENAYTNMKSSMVDSAGRPTGAERPGFGDLVAGVPALGSFGNALRSPNRQKFVQATSSLSEALLRAATGAGVNADEAKQKVQEITPVWGEDEATTRQKMAAIPVYLETLKVRAGPLAKKPIVPASSAQPAMGGISLDAIEAELARRRKAQGG